jgi:hypothetical protein
MKLLTFLLEPLQEVDMPSVRKELAELRAAGSSAWAIAEVIERVLSVTEVVLAVDAKRRS